MNVIFLSSNDDSKIENIFLLFLYLCLKSNLYPESFYLLTEFASVQDKVVLYKASNSV